MYRNKKYLNKVRQFFNQLHSRLAYPVTPGPELTPGSLVELFSPSWGSRRGSVRLTLSLTFPIPDLGARSLPSLVCLLLDPDAYSLPRAHRCFPSPHFLELFSRSDRHTMKVVVADNSPGCLLILGSSFSPSFSLSSLFSSAIGPHRQWIQRFCTLQSVGRRWRNSETVRNPFCILRFY